MSIERDAAVLLLQKAVDCWDRASMNKDDYVEAVKLALSALKGSPAQWVPAKEHIPDPGERVIASNGSFAGEAYIGYRNGEKVWFRYYGITWEGTGIAPPDRWAPMPK